MAISKQANELFDRFVVEHKHSRNDYFSLIRELVEKRSEEGESWQHYIDKAYTYLLDEIIANTSLPTTPIKFGTSGWRGKLGKDVFVQSAAYVTAGIVEMYRQAEHESDIATLLQIESFSDACTKGAVVGFDNRFGGQILAASVVEVLRNASFTVHYAGESTTGVLSAAVLELGAAFSINLTPSHNPLEYGGFKYNAADGGPAEATLTNRITKNSLDIVEAGSTPYFQGEFVKSVTERDDIQRIDSLQLWIDLVRKNQSSHGLDYDQIISSFEQNDDLALVVDSVHGASRIHLKKLLNNTGSQRFIHLRAEEDVTFGGIAPEPSSINMQGVTETLKKCTQTLKLGAIIDPDADRIRFTDGTTEISMNQFGAMAYHFLYKHKGKKGLIAKTVATSNMANALGKAFGEEVFEPRVGFKEFKPVIGKALVYFEESDGISVIGHTPEKDAYIGLLLAMDMVLSLGINLGEYKQSIEEEFGAYYPDRDGVEVSVKGEELLAKLALLEKYATGSVIEVGDQEKVIKEVIDIDGRKMIFEDDSWLMIRPSGTEPKVRFYVESRDPKGTSELVASAKHLLAEIGLL